MAGRMVCAARGCERTAGPRSRGQAPPVAPRLCVRCRRRVEADLRRLPVLYAECEQALVPSSWMLTERVTGGRRTGPAPDEAVMAARSDMLAVLAGWAGLVAEQRRVARPARREVGDLCRYLVRHLDWLLAHDGGAEFAAEIVAVADQARRALHGPKAVRRVLGTCVHTGCDGEMYAMSGSGKEVRPTDVRCDRGHTWPPSRRLELFARMNQDQVSRRVKESR
ncbi:hypothetical protein Acsp04_56940 [Actinomadura sp. NBRC 104425]|uniref:hypothetical protein n=1 Tax=Actinomadura sp. NBRC 104425 TaxID=3032204 RepID=UPI0024A5AB4E|nr:hypothetical protein [Actinomadura sp. NBRC 104425]GLZ15459.1 hypothetical protein Acsp04_56940 [Actinomadura sp. NBRC 104425]